MKNSISLEVSNAACGIDCIVLYDNDDRLIKSISHERVKSIELAVNSHDALTEQNKHLIDTVEDLISTFDYETNLEVELLSIAHAKKLISKVKRE